MSCLPTYVLVCDGDGCPNRIVFTRSPPRIVGEARKRAADEEGWSHDFKPLGKTGQGRPLDFCRTCTTARNTTMARDA